MELGLIRMLYRLILVVVMVLSSFATGLAAQEAIGTVTRVQGQASVTHESATRALALNASVFLNEVVSTGQAARLQLTFADNTLVTLGENTRLTLDRYVFNPSAGRGIIRFRVDGAVRFLSGQVSKLARASVIVTTRVANIGVRGTEFWAGPIDNLALGVLLIEGVVRVSNVAGERVLAQPGQGTNIATAGATPGPVTVWPQDKVNRALASVTFQ
jgi:hypothetical protein